MGIDLFRVLTLVLVFVCGPALADPSRLEDILHKRVLRVGMTGDYPPFGSLDRVSGTYAGLDVDMARSLSAALGVDLEIVPTSWQSLARDFDAGAFDIAMGGVSISLERAKKGLFSTPYLRDGKAAISRCSEVTRFPTLADIDRPRIKVIVNPGGTNEKFDRANLKEATIVTHDDNTTIFDSLAAGDADLMITDASEARYQQKLHPGVLCAIHPEAPFSFAEKAYWMPFDLPLKEFVDQWLHMQIENGALATFSAKWFE